MRSLSTGPSVDAVPQPHKLALGWRVALFAVLAVIVCEPVRSQENSPDRGRRFLDSYESGVDSVASVSDIPDLVSSLKQVAPDWITKDASRSRTRRHVVTLAVLELVSRTTRSSRSADLEWACTLLREGQPDRFEQQWMLAAASLLGTLPIGSAAITHLEHARKIFPADPDLRLAELLLRPETVTVANVPKVDLDRLARATWYGQVKQFFGGPTNLSQTADRLRALSSEPGVGVEATARLGLVEFLRGQLEPSLLHLESAAERADDAYIQSLSWLLHGLILDAQGSHVEAERSYRSSFNALPTTTAGTALAVALFLRDQRADAASVLATAYGPSRAVRDPWRDPVGSQRHFQAYVNGLRTLVSLPARPSDESVTPQVPRVNVAISTPATPLKATENGEPQVFRASVDSVLVDVAVFDGKTPVVGLSQDEFVITDNGVPQTITSGSIDTVPLDVTVVLEMNDPVIGAGHWQPANAIGDVSRLTDLLKPQDRLRLLVAGIDGPVDAVPLQSVQTATSLRVRPSGLASAALNNSTVFDATAAALMASVPADRRGLVLIFTDGIDGASVVTSDQLLNVARRTEAVAYLARRYTGAELARRTNPMARDIEQLYMLRPVPPTKIEDIVDATGGRTTRPTPAEPMAKLFDDALASFRDRYLFHYTPTGVAGPGWHTIRVSLKKPGRYVVVARKGYLGVQ